MRSLFEKNLMRMKQELTDLKTVHNRGLGTIEFFRYRTTFQASANSFNYVTGTIATDEPGNPLVTALASHSSGNADAIVRSSYSNGSGVGATIFCRKAGTVTVDIISSSVLNGISKS